MANQFPPFNQTNKCQSVFAQHEASNMAHWFHSIQAKGKKHGGLVNLKQQCYGEIFTFFQTSKTIENKKTHLTLSASL